MFGNSAFGESAFGEDPTPQAAGGISPASAALSFVGYAPTLGQASGFSPSAATVAFAGFAPAIGQGASISPGPCYLNVFGPEPSVGGGRSVSPAPLPWIITGLEPSITRGTETELKPITIAQFRLDFPEFSDPVKYTNAQIRVQLVAGSMILGELIWGDMWGYAIELRTAHYLTIKARNAAAATGGGAGGAVSGFMTSKQVDKASASYDFGATTYEGAGFWNTTSYGVEFWQLMMLFGAGVIQL